MPPPPVPIFLPKEGPMTTPPLANQLSAQRYRLAATIAENGGRTRFPALFDLNGNLVPAKLVDTTFGASWGILADEDPESEIVRWVNRSTSASSENRRQAMEAKGFREGAVMAPAKAQIVGRGTAFSRHTWVAAVRTDGGFSRDVDVVYDGSTVGAAS
jgi:hypothetical protein